MLLRNVCFIYSTYKKLRLLLSSNKNIIFSFYFKRLYFFGEICFGRDNEIFFYNKQVNIEPRVTESYGSLSQRNKHKYWTVESCIVMYFEKKKYWFTVEGTTNNLSFSYEPNRNNITIKSQYIAVKNIMDKGIN